MEDDQEGAPALTVQYFPDHMLTRMSQWYKEDLAHIHDVGFGDYALAAAPGILKIL